MRGKSRCAPRRGTPRLKDLSIRLLVSLPVLSSDTAAPATDARPHFSHLGICADGPMLEDFVLHVSSGDTLEIKRGRVTLLVPSSRCASRVPISRKSCLPFVAFELVTLHSQSFDLIVSWRFGLFPRRVQSLTPRGTWHSWLSSYASGCTTAPCNVAFLAVFVRCGMHDGANSRVSTSTLVCRRVCHDPRSHLAWWVDGVRF